MVASYSLRNSDKTRPGLKTWQVSHNFIHVPQHLDPCPGTVIEAILAGCKVIYNNNVGTLSYPYKTRDDWVKALAESGKLFWQRVTNTFNK